jgi:mRNA-degrading endonuclease RelE of RelBE toxin-antitoxin system
MYTIELTPEAEDNLRWFDRRDRHIIVDGIRTNLSYQPNVITLNRKPCRDDGTKIADWELRLGVYRVYYNVEELVMVAAI